MPAPDQVATTPKALAKRRPSIHEPLGLDDIDIAHAATYDPDVLVFNAGVIESGSVVDIPMERVR